MKKIKSFLLAGISAMVFTGSNAQNPTSNGIVTGIIAFTGVDAATTAKAPDLQEVVADVMSTKKHITLLDRTKVKQIEDELELQKKSHYMDGVTVAQDKLYGAKQLLAGTITSIGADPSITNYNETTDLITHKKIPARTETKYRSNINFALQIIDTETGIVISDRVFNLNSMGKLFKFDAPPLYATKEAAMSNAVADAKKRIIPLIHDFINVSYPPPLVLATVDTKNKKGFPETVSLTGGTEANLSVGNDLIIYEVQHLMVNGVKKIRKTEIGSLRVKELQGDFTSCRVTEGEEMLESKWKNSTLEITVKPKK